MEIDILIKAVLPVRRQNVAPFNLRLFMNVSKQKEKKPHELAIRIKNLFWLLLIEGAHHAGFIFVSS